MALSFCFFCVVPAFCFLDERYYNIGLKPDGSTIDCTIVL
jgi:hypothetical protein